MTRLLPHSIVVHGHFYQPPRENAWLESIELQESAYPFHDWNQRINAECYLPNASSRILDERGRIVRIVNNYSRISFNFGPTLLSWLEARDPKTYAAILEADRDSARRFSGHGSALAQVYSHPILPLCNERDQRTQVQWGLRDFEHRFGRRPEGMWLPETATDLASLELLARSGIRFTILAPSQACKFRAAGETAWRDVGERGIDSRRSYRLALPSGASIALFFYDGAISQAVAFKRLLSRGDLFARRLMRGFDGDRTDEQLVHIATDGETYGHHHPHGDMALAWALNAIEADERVQLTNYGEFLELRPPADEVQIVENSSWSCAHGLGRWREDCGCSAGSNPGWNQRWREPLRDALDWLRDALAPRFERRALEFLRDPWSARDDYIDVILDRSPDSIARFFQRHARRPLDVAETTQVLELLEIQRHALLMYTSCAWFFDELSGIETLQVLQYAGRALQLASESFGESLETPFLERLARARSNLAQHGDGRSLFLDKVKPAAVDLAKVGANHAASLLFDGGDDGRHGRGFRIETTEHRRLESGKHRLVLGRLKVASKITLEDAELTFAFLHLGDQNLSGGVRPFRDDAAYAAMLAELSEAFEAGDSPEVARRLDRHFGRMQYSLQTLFRDEQRQILERTLASTLTEVEAVYRSLYEHHAPLMRFLTGIDASPPRPLQIAAELVLNTGLRRELEQPDFDPERVGRVLADASSAGVPLDRAGVAYAASGALERLLLRFTHQPDDEALLDKINRAARLVRTLDFDVDLHEPENLYYDLLQTVYPGYRTRAAAGEQSAERWVDVFTSLGATLRFAID